MQKIYRIVVLSLWFINSLAYAQVNPSQSFSKHAVSNINFAILDHDHIMQEAAAARLARQEIEQKRTEFQKELDRYEQTLREFEHQLIELQKILSEEQYSQKRQDFESRVTETHRIVAERRGQLEDSFNNARETIVAATLKIVTEIAQQQGYQIVFPKSIVFYHSAEAHDITLDVLKKLNATLPKISLKHIEKKVMP